MGLTEMIMVAFCAGHALGADDEFMTFSPVAEGPYLFLETFQGVEGQGQFVKSGVEKYTGQPVSTLADVDGLEGDLVMSFDEAAKHYGITAPFSATGVGDAALVVQYEARFNEGLDCGGAYVKLLAQESLPNLKNVDNETPYIIMFGPDKCGTTRKIHLILRHQNPVSGEWEEKHLKTNPTFNPKKTTQLFTLVINADDSFSILVDNEEVSSGSLMEDFEPPVNPPKQIPDPDDVKPEDWVEEAQIADPEESKPDDWDEDAPLRIEDAEAAMPSDWLEAEELIVADPSAQSPDDWDDDEDGEWEAPMVPNAKCSGVSGCGPWERPTIDNPAYKGLWSAPMIANPDYVGVWAPQQIDNKNFFELANVAETLAPISAVAIEVWTMNGQMTFDNFLITHDAEVASTFASQTFSVKLETQKETAAARVEESKRLQQDALLDGSVAGYVHFAAAKASDNMAATMGVLVVFCVLVVVACNALCSCCSDAPVPPPAAAAAKAGDKKVAKADAKATKPAKNGDAAESTTQAKESSKSGKSDSEDTKEVPEENIDSSSIKSRLRSRKKRTPKAE